MTKRSPVPPKSKEITNNYSPTDHAPPLPDNWLLLKSTTRSDRTLGLSEVDSREGPSGLQLMTIGSQVACKRFDGLGSNEVCIVVR